MLAFANRRKPWASILTPSAQDDVKRCCAALEMHGAQRFEGMESCAQALLPIELPEYGDMSFLRELKPDGMRAEELMIAGLAELSFPEGVMPLPPGSRSPFVISPGETNEE